MSQASETESDSSSDERLDSAPSLPLTMQSYPEASHPITHERALRSIHNIDTSDARAAASDPNMSREDLSIILSFLEHTLDLLSSYPETHITEDHLLVITLLTRQFFLARVFHFRDTLEDQNPKPAELVETLCGILKHIITISGILCTDTCRNTVLSVPKGLREIQERDLHNSIKNLPRSWYAIPNILSGKTQSPSTQRCALHLLFVAYVLGPQLGNDSPPGSSHKIVLGHLYQCIDNALNSQSFLLTSGKPEQSHLTLAMFICLFSSVHTAVSREQSSDVSVSPMRPRSFGFLLELIMTVLGHPFNEPAFPLQRLTPAQRLLLRWGKVVPWSWSVWQDRRTADSEQVLFLTSTWMYHNDAPPSRLVCHPTLSLEAALKQCPRASATILQELLHSLNRAICVTSPLAEDWEEHRKAVFKTLIGCIQSFIILLLDENLATEQGWVQGLVPSCCESILGIFCYADEKEELARVGKELILEALSFIDKRRLRSCIEKATLSKTVHFLTRLDFGRLPVISACIKEISHGHLSALQQTESALHFTQILWHSDSTLTNMFAGKSLVAQAVQLCTAPEESPKFVRFRASVISTSSLLGDDFPPKHRDMLEKVATDAAQGVQDLATASALSLFVIKNAAVDDVTLALSTWDYLRTCLSSILSGRYLCEERPLALILSSIVCHALSRLWAMNIVVERFATSSPWTLSLSSAVRSLLEEKGVADIDEYSSALKCQLQDCGRVLLRQIRVECQGRLEAKPDIKVLYIRGRTGDGFMVAKIQ